MTTVTLIARASAFLKVHPVDPIEAINLIVELTNALERCEKELEELAMENKVRDEHN